MQKFYILLAECMYGVYKNKFNHTLEIFEMTRVNKVI